MRDREESFAAPYLDAAIAAEPRSIALPLLWQAAVRERKRAHLARCRHIRDRARDVFAPAPASAPLTARQRAPRPADAGAARVLAASRGNRVAQRLIAGNPFQWLRGAPFLSDPAPRAFRRPHAAQPTRPQERDAMRSGLVNPRFKPGCVAAVHALLSRRASRLRPRSICLLSPTLIVVPASRATSAGAADCPL